MCNLQELHLRAAPAPLEPPRTVVCGGRSLLNMWGVSNETHRALPAVVISATKDGVKFTTSGDVGTANVTVRQNTTADKVRGRRRPCKQLR